MAEPSFSNPFASSTIDEPVTETIMRDVRLVCRRLGLVMLPATTSSVIRAELRDWDLWGPLFICMSLAVMLSITVHEEASLVFSAIFVIVWVGAALVTINGQLLGGKLSFFQSVCLLGYCVFPLLAAAIACLLLNEFVSHDLAVVLRFVVVVAALGWTLFASSSFMTDADFPPGRKILALYPVFLFYASLAWIVLIGFQQGASSSATTAPAAPTNGSQVANTTKVFFVR